MCGAILTILRYSKPKSCDRVSENVRLSGHEIIYQTPPTPIWYYCCLCCFVFVTFGQYLIILQCTIFPVSQKNNNRLHFKRLLFWFLFGFTLRFSHLVCRVRERHWTHLTPLSQAVCAMDILYRRPTAQLRRTFHSACLSAVSEAFSGGR